MGFQKYDNVIIDFGGGMIFPLSVTPGLVLNLC